MDQNVTEFEAERRREEKRPSRSCTPAKIHLLLGFKGSQITFSEILSTSTSETSRNTFHQYLTEEYVKNIFLLQLPLTEHYFLQFWPRANKLIWPHLRGLLKAFSFSW